MLYADLYRHGFHEFAWRKLHELSRLQASCDVRNDIERVAMEFVRKAYRNLSAIRDELINLRYPFRNPDHVLLDARLDAISRIDDFQDRYGFLPVVIKAWYTVFHEIDFRQDPIALEMEKTHSRTAIAGIGFNCTLLFEPFEECASKLTTAFLPHRNKEYVLPTGAVGTNGDPMGAGVPSNSLDCVFYNDGAGDVMFGDFIRRICMSCGFPLWTMVGSMSPGQLGFERFPDLNEYYRTVVPQLEAL